MKLPETLTACPAEPGDEPGGKTPGSLHESAAIGGIGEIGANRRAGSQEDSAPAPAKIGTNEQALGKRLSETHLAALRASAIDDVQALRRGYRTVTDPKELADLGVTPSGRRVPGLLVPMFDAKEQMWGHQYRPDDPRETRGKVVKYETPSGQRNRLDVPPRAGGQVADPTVPLWITEGSKKADAGVSAGLCVVAMTGVWNWTAPKKSKDEPHRLMESLRNVPLEGRRVILAFDGDVARKPQVHLACETLAAKLVERGATVEYLHLPDTDDKTGLDDFLAAGGTAEELWELVKPDPPADPLVDGDRPVFNPCPVVYDGPPLDGATLLDELEAWFERFIGVVNPDDCALLALWAVHTHLMMELWSSPRLMLDSIVPGSGKTTVLEHLKYLCNNALHCINSLSKALVPRVLDQSMATFLLDEVDRTLRPDGPSTEDLLSVINGGYKRGASAPTLVPGPDGAWVPSQFPCYAPVALAGNSPNLPEDTKSRVISILLMPALDDQVDDTDWFLIEPEIHELTARVIAWANQVREQITSLSVDLPPGCRGRNRERWRPLMWIAVAAGGDWPARVDKLIRADLEHQAAEREDGTGGRATPQIIALTHLFKIWPKQAKNTPAKFVETKELVRLLVGHDRYWQASSAYGRELTVQRLGQLVHKATKETTSRQTKTGPRGYYRSQLEPAWRHLRISGGQEPAPDDQEPAPRGNRPESAEPAESATDPP